MGLNFQGEDIARENVQNAWAGLRMIRETIETLGPPGRCPPRKPFYACTGPNPFTRLPRSPKR
jgi:hypothetical protein